MKVKVEITLPTLPYNHDTSEVLAYLQIVIAELTGNPVKLEVSDIDFTDKISVFKQMRKPSIFNR